MNLLMTQKTKLLQNSGSMKHIIPEQNFIIRTKKSSQTQKISASAAQNPFSQKDQMQSNRYGKSQQMLKNQLSGVNSSQNYQKKPVSKINKRYSAMETDETYEQSPEISGKCSIEIESDESMKEQRQKQIEMEMQKDYQKLQNCQKELNNISKNFQKSTKSFSDYFEFVTESQTLRSEGEKILNKQYSVELDDAGNDQQQKEKQSFRSAKLLKQKSNESQQAPQQSIFAKNTQQQQRQEFARNRVVKSNSYKPKINEFQQSAQKLKSNSILPRQLSQSQLSNNNKTIFNNNKNINNKIQYNRSFYKNTSIVSSRQQSEQKPNLVQQAFRKSIRHYQV